MPTYKIQLGNTFDTLVQTEEVTTASSLAGDDITEKGSFVYFTQNAAIVAIYPSSRILTIVRVTELAAASGK